MKLKKAVVIGAALVLGCLAAFDSRAAGETMKQCWGRGGQNYLSPAANLPTDNDEGECRGMPQPAPEPQPTPCERLHESWQRHSAIAGTPDEDLPWELRSRSDDVQAWAFSFAVEQYLEAMERGCAWSSP